MEITKEERQRRVDLVEAWILDRQGKQLTRYQRQLVLEDRKDDWKYNYLKGGGRC